MTDPRTADRAGVMTAPYVLEYTYRRSTGPTVGRFLTGLREERIEGSRTSDGRVVVPPTEFDVDGAETERFATVANEGVVTTWAWVERPRANHPLARPFAFALVRLDGADTAMLHAVDAGAIENMRTGMRVRARFRAERVGHILDVACFEPVVGA